MSNERFTLRTEGLRKSFGGVEVLHGVDLEVHGGRVLALLGENGAGKSTTIKILTGDYRADGGDIWINDELMTIRQPRDAKDLGIRVIYQEFSDAPDLTVAENIWLGDLPTKHGLIDWRTVRRRAAEVVAELNIELDPRQVVGELGVAERQILEIARAMAGSARMLVLDEPTSALSAEEVQRLFDFVRRLRAQGTAIIYITHRLDEVEELADDVVVFRDGVVVASGESADFDRAGLIEAMIGRELGDEISELEDAAPAEVTTPPAVQVTGLTCDGLFDDIDLTVRPGEIGAMFGRVGCGAVEFAETLFGMRRPSAGDAMVVNLQGTPLDPVDAIRRGVGYVPPDRKTQGLLSGLSTSDNLSVASWRRLAQRGVLRPSTTDKVWTRWRDVLGIVARGGGRQEIDTLSGGNQQKVVLGRWLESECRLLVLVEPTRGVDVGARVEIYRVIEDLAERGVGVLVVSSDVEEVLRLAHRVHVVSRGRIVGEFTRPHLDRAAIIAAASTDPVEATSIAS